MNLVLIGFQNAGKTQVGQALANALKKEFIDTDQLIEKDYLFNTGSALTVRDIYQQEGKLFFRQSEKTVVSSLARMENTLIATGGGTVLDKDSMILLKQKGFLIYLAVPKNVLKKRFLQKPLPSFIDKANFKESFEILYESRHSLYTQIADFVFLVHDNPIQSITQQLHEKLKDFSCQPR